MVTTVTDGWFEPSQGVWQDDKRFKDAPDKRLTRLGPTSWKAELKMVAGRQTAIYGNREHDYIRVAMNGTTTGSRLVKVRFRFKLIDSGGERIIWEQAKAENYIPIDGPAGPPGPWGASLQTHRGVPEWSEFTIKPGPYTIEMELLRDEGTPTGLKVTLSGEAVETARLPLRLVPVALSDAAVAAPGALVAQAQRIATEAGEFVPQTFPMKPASFAPTVEPLLDLRTIEPGRFDTFISLLPGTDAIEQVRGERVATTIEERFGTSAGLTGGGKTAIVLTEDDFGRLWRQKPDFRAAAYTHSAKLIVLLDSNEGTTLAHELIHTLPYLWSKPQMQALFGFSYHNSDDIGYASGPTVTRYYRERFDGTDAIMGPSGGSKWITQGSYFHLLSELRSVPDPDLIVTRGFIARTGTGFVASFNPLYQVVGEPDLRARAAATGEFAIVLRDRAGVERGRYPFGVSWQLPDIDVNRTTTAFMYRVPDSPDVAEIQIVGPNGNVLDRRRRSASAPAVSITSPVANATVTPANDKIRIQWTAFDADRDALTYMVLYSPDGGANWRVASYEQTATSFDLPIVGRPSAPRVRVIATDGARSRTAEVSFSFAR